MASSIPGVSTLGVLCGYAAETTAGTKPTTFKLLHRINTIDEIAIDTETIDASALEDLLERTIAGRGSTGGTFSVTVNLTDETLDEWEKLIEEYEALASGLVMWFEVWFPDLTKAFFVKFEPPTKIPQPAVDQNSLLTVAMTLTINEYVGPDTAIKPTEAAA